MTPTKPVTPLAPGVIRALAPMARAPYLEAFADADSALAASGANASPLRLAHFLAQALQETGGLTVLEENLSYRSDRILVVWPTRFATPADAAPYARNPRALANKVYGGRMGNTGPDDGWIYRGRGPFQLTGLEDYVRHGKVLGVDLEAHPELALDPRYCLRLAGAEWLAKGCNAAADADDVVTVTRKINGGLIGLPERKAWLAKTKAALSVP